jgi:hypothetical protein
MMLTTPRITFLAALIWSLGAVAANSAAQQSLEEDRTGVYRPHLEVERGQFIRVPDEEIKPGFAYSYYNQRLSRRVWGLARDDGSFHYAFGEGTTLPVDVFDLRLPRETEARRLEEASPGLQQRLAITGGAPAVVMTAGGTWRLLPFQSLSSVFDIETGHRWEWHGRRRVAVLHTDGDQWQVVDGRYRPLGGGFLAVPAGCGTFHRAGSAAYVMRTPEAPR